MGWNLVLVLRGGEYIQIIQLSVRQYILGKAEWKQTTSLIIGPAGKIYQGGVPYISKIFRDESEAENYLSQVGLHLRSSTKQSEFLPSFQTQLK